MNIYIGADHRGFEKKNQLVSWLQEQSFTVTDVGNSVLDPQDDYPDFAFAVGKQVASQKDAFGIVLCGSGVGVSVAADKIHGIRTVLGFSEEIIRASRTDDNVNVLALPADYVDIEEMKKRITVFLTTIYTPEEKYERRLAKIAAQEHSGN